MNVPHPPTAEDLERLMAQYAEVAALAGGLAHEIKNPLSTIRLNLELLGEDFADPQSRRDRQALNRIVLLQRECERLQNVLDSFVNFVKLRNLKLEPSDLNQQVERALEFFAPSARESNIEMIYYPEADLPSVVLDREAFQGALINLVLNAQQAMPNGGQLALRTGLTPAGVALELIDTGVGMDEQTRSHIFDTFYSTKPGGSGLGLPTTRKIVEAHGGRIACQSEVGHGTRFTIELPVPQRLTANEAVLAPSDVKVVD